MNEKELIIKLTRIIQRLEQEGVDLTIDDIKTVRMAKTYLGYCNPASLSNGTESRVSDIKQ